MHPSSFPHFSQNTNAQVNAISESLSLSISKLISRVHGSGYLIQALPLVPILDVSYLKKCKKHESEFAPNASSLDKIILHINNGNCSYLRCRDATSLSPTCESRAIPGRLPRSSKQSPLHVMVVSFSIFNFHLSSALGIFNLTQAS